MRSLSLLALLACLCTAQSVHAQDYSRDYNRADMSNRFGARLMLGLGGELDPDGVPGDVDLETTYGLGLSFEVPVHQFVTVGALVGFHSFQTEVEEDLEIDRNTLLDLDGFVKLRYPTHLGSMGFEPYLLLPLGVSFVFPSDDYDDRETGFGLNAAFMLGGLLFVSDSVGLNLELGYVWHSASHDEDVGDGDFEYDLGYVGLNFGVVIALD